MSHPRPSRSTREHSTSTPISTPAVRGVRGARGVLHSLLAALLAVAIAALGLLVAPPAGAVPAYPTDLDKFFWFGNYRIDDIWRLGATGQGITVAVVDSGVNPGGELAGHVLAGSDLAGGDGRRDTDSPRGHGTAMARIIAAQGGGANGLTGIAPGSDILPVTTASVGKDDAAAGPEIDRGIRYAADKGARIINVSEGVTAACAASTQSAVAYAVGRGSIVVAASGNDGAKGNPVVSPASCKGVLAVGTIYGDKTPWPDSGRGSYVDVAAPGVDMADENLAGEAGTSSGTSNSAALVSGAAALVWSKFPKLTARQVVARLLASVTDDNAVKGKDDATGYGIVRPYYAITDTIPADAPNPVFDELKGAGSGTSSAPSAGGSGGSGPASTSPSGPASAADDSDSGSNLLVRVGGVVVILVILLVIVLVVLRSRRPKTPAGPGPWPPGGYGPPPGPPSSGGWSG